MELFVLIMCVMGAMILVGLAVLHYAQDWGDRSIGMLAVVLAAPPFLGSVAILLFEGI